MKPQTPTLTASVLPNSMVLNGSAVNFTCHTASSGSSLVYSIYNEKDEPININNQNPYQLTFNHSVESDSFTCRASISNMTSAPSNNYEITVIGKYAYFASKAH